MVDHRLFRAYFPGAVGHFPPTVSCSPLLQLVSATALSLFFNKVRREACKHPSPLLLLPQGMRGVSGPPGLLAPHMLWGFRGCEKVVRVPGILFGI